MKLIRAASSGASDYVTRQGETFEIGLLVGVSLVMAGLANAQKIDAKVKVLKGTVAFVAETFGRISVRLLVFLVANAAAAFADLSAVSIHGSELVHSEIIRESDWLSRRLGLEKS